ncbi:hypothetical protein [Halalkalibacterium ligniniphilum]|uniref:hypothetical protein n=1 Tax=Halalkalibacterium ligniniphilum TaxID=1134413 RepID=UPI000344FA97|nr:hypothetical protein [Halalkalibacterium ligniniphilum]
MYKKGILLCIIAAFMTLIACSNAKEAESFSSKEEALEYYIEKENIQGMMVLIHTTSGDQILISEYREDLYHLGELLTMDHSFSTIKLTEMTSFKNSPGGIMEFSTSNGMDYTIKFDNEEHVHSVSLPDNKFHISIVEEHVLSKMPYVTTAAIESIEIIKN